MAVTTSNSPITLDAIATKLDQLIGRVGAIDQRFLSIKHAAKYVDISPKSIRRLIDQGTLQAYRPVRGRIVVDRREVDALVLASGRRPRTGRGLSVGKQKTPREVL